MALGLAIASNAHLTMKRGRLALPLGGIIGLCVILGQSGYPAPATPIHNRKTEAYVREILRSKLPAKWRPLVPAIVGTLLTESQYYGIDPIMVLAIIRQESNFNPAVIGRHGERGLMQIRPATARWIGKIAQITQFDLFNPQQNIQIGMAYLKWLSKQFPGGNGETLSAYNMGPEAMTTFIMTSGQSFTPYAVSVLRHYRRIESWIRGNRSALNLGHAQANSAKKFDTIFE